MQLEQQQAADGRGFGMLLAEKSLEQRCGPGKPSRIMRGRLHELGRELAKRESFREDFGFRM